jgi:hypothetical protein
VQQARPVWGWSCRWWVVGLALLAAVVCSEPVSAQPARPVVYVVPIAGVIDLGLAPFVRRVLEEAAGADAAGSRPSVPVNWVRQQTRHFCELV